MSDLTSMMEFIGYILFASVITVIMGRKNVGIMIFIGFIFMVLGYVLNISFIGITGLILAYMFIAGIFAYLLFLKERGDAI
jgi:hypothetical protein